jgi:hypothetical protein
MSPFHKSKLFRFFIIQIFIFQLLLSLLINIESICLNNRNISSRTNIVRTCMHLSICTLICSGYLKQPHQRQSLKYPTTHGFYFLINYKKQHKRQIIKKYKFMMRNTKYIKSTASLLLLHIHLSTFQLQFTLVFILRLIYFAFVCVLFYY